MVVVVPLVREVRRCRVVAESSTTSLVVGALPDASAKVSTLWSPLKDHVPGRVCGSVALHRVAPASSTKDLSARNWKKSSRSQAGNWAYMSTGAALPLAIVHAVLRQFLAVSKSMREEVAGAGSFLQALSAATTNSNAESFFTVQVCGKERSKSSHSPDMLRIGR